MANNALKLPNAGIAVLMYSHDGFGLGHLKRNITLATRLVQEIPGSRILLIAGHANLPWGALPYGVDFIKLPSILKTETGIWQSRSLPIENKVLRDLRASVIQKAAEHFNPDFFLVDYTPTGVWGELIPTLEMLKTRQRPVSVFLGLRDILDAPEVTQEIWAREGNYDAIRQYYDKVLIYGRPEIFNTASQYGLEKDLAKKNMYCGYLCADDNCKPKEQMRRELKIRKKKLIVVTAGGGADAYPMMQLAMKALAKLSAKVSAEAIFITGPLMIAEQRQSLEIQARELPVRVLPCVEELIHYMNAADLIVTMASYNTLMDAVRLSKPILSIPREGPSAEQKLRAALFSRLGLVTALESPAKISPGQLASRILEALTHSFSPGMPLDMMGLQKVTRYFGHLVKKRNHEQREISRTI